MAINAPAPDEPLLTTLKPVADPIWGAVGPDLHAILATQLTARLHDAHRHFDGDLGTLLASRYGDHIRMRNRRAEA